MNLLSRRRFLYEAVLMGGMFLPSYLSPLEKRPRQRNKKKNGAYPSYLKLYEEGELSKRVEELYSLYEECHLCPRDCRVNRRKGEKGNCEATSTVKVSSAFPHFGEEKPLVGEKGSGTIFFSNCGLRCVYCQNYSVSIEGEGVEISDERLAESMLKLKKMGVHNINLVTPTHYLPSILNALQKAIPKGLDLPLVYNTGGYERVEILKLLNNVVDIYLPDLKYMDPQCAARYSDEAYNYPYYAQLAVQEMNRQVGPLQVNRRGVALKGLALRHLILPNGVSGTKEFLRFVSKKLPQNTYLNLMSQYRPEYKAREYPQIDHRLKRREYARALGWAKEFGLTRLAR